MDRVILIIGSLVLVIFEIIVGINPAYTAALVFLWMGLAVEA